MTADALDVRPVAGGVRVGVRVMPRGSRAAIAGVRDGCLLVRVTAPPVDGAANAAVIEILAKALGRPRRSVTIVAGHTARRKTIEIQGVSASDLRTLR